MIDAYDVRADDRHRILPRRGAGGRRSRLAEPAVSGRVRLLHLTDGRNAVTAARISAVTASRLRRCPVASRGGAARPGRPPRQLDELPDVGIILGPGVIRHSRRDEDQSPDAVRVGQRQAQRGPAAAAVPTMTADPSVVRSMTARRSASRVNGPAGAGERPKPRSSYLIAGTISEQAQHGGPDARRDPVRSPVRRVPAPRCLPPISRRRATEPSAPCSPRGQVTARRRGIRRPPRRTTVRC